MSKYTYEDVLTGKCEHWQVGTSKIDANIVINKYTDVQANSPKDAVSLYLDVFHKIGGAQELEKFAKANPGKFYDQLLRLLISMEAPKKVMEVHVNLQSLSRQDMESMSSADLKRMMLSAMPNALEGECREISDS